MIYKYKPVKRGVLPTKYAAFDCETEGLGGEARLICVVFPDGKSKIFKGNNCSKQFFDEVTRPKYRNTIFFAHNADFDITKTFGKVLGNIIDNKQMEYRSVGSRLIYAKYHLPQREGNITFLDTFNFIPNKLSSIGEDLGFLKHPTPKKWLSGKPITENMIDADDINYCKRDCEIVLKILDTLAEMFKPFNITLKPTIASNAKAIWKSIYLKDNLFINDVDDEKFRKAYYGGRTEVFIRRYEKISLFHYDVNSLYPSVMQNNLFPNPDKLKYSKDIHKALIHNEGMAKITIKIPDMKYPPLPVRTDRLIFPVGIVTGEWCFPEIRNALAHGCEIIECFYVLSSPPIKSPFEEYIEYFKTKKIFYGKNKMFALKNLAKILQNSLYGKFAQRNDIEERYTHDMPDIGINFKPVGKNTYILGNVPKERADETVVCWAAYVTSYARVVLYSYFPRDNLYYCDTDSIFVTEPLADEVVDNDEYGLMALEHKVISSFFVAPKRYWFSYLDEDDNIRDVKKIKGVGKDAVQKIDSQHFGDDMCCTFSKLRKNKTALRQNKPAFELETVSKNLKKRDDKRTFSIDGNSLPIVITPD